MAEGAIDDILDMADVVPAGVPQRSRTLEGGGPFAW